MVERALEEWRSGINRFDRDGEAFFVAIAPTHGVVGMCGLNVDLFVPDPGVGRVRRLYVLPGYRRSGIARRLVAACLACAEGAFHRVRVRTFEPDAAKFYEVIAFSPIDSDSATHAIDLGVND